MITAEKTVRWPEDSTRINVGDMQELWFWSRRFRVSREKLKQAVRAVGPNFKDVQCHLDSKRQ